MNADRHPDSEALRAFRQHRLSGAEVITIARHLGHCDECAGATAADSKAVLRALVSPEEVHLSDEGPLRTKPSRWWLAAAAVLALVTSIAITVGRRSPAPLDHVAPPQIVSRSRGREVARSSWHNPATPQPRDSATSPLSAPEAVASLIDASGRIELRDDGTLAGIDVASPADAARARVALSRGSLTIPTFIAAMPGSVRGSTSAEPPPIRVLQPFRSAVRDSRPQFAWTPARNARGYRVAVYDADYEEVASSEKLTVTSWRPSKPLPAGVDLTWHVVADTPEGEISSAGSDRAEAVFRVLSPAEARQLAHDEELYRQSHLLRGLLYSRLGLLHDAEREFRALAALNPNAPLPAKLIDSVSARE
jgi:hypothetical protein